MYVKLISSDEHEFVIKKDLALSSGTIRMMMTGPGEVKENQVNEVYLTLIP